MKKKVISRAIQPTPLPILHTLVIVLALDFWNSPEWLMGVAGVHILVLWVGFFYRIFITEEIDILNVKDDKEEFKESIQSRNDGLMSKSFQDKIKEMVDKAEKQN